MDVHLITDAGVSQCGLEDLPDLLGRREGLVWVDIPRVDREAAQVLQRWRAQAPWRSVTPAGSVAGNQGA